MPTALEHRQAIDEAVSALHKALLAAHEDGLAVMLNSTSTDHIRVKAIGFDPGYIREPARVDLMDVAEFVEGEVE